MRIGTPRPASNSSFWSPASTNVLGPKRVGRGDGGRGAEQRDPEISLRMGLRDGRETEKNCQYESPHDALPQMLLRGYRASVATIKSA